MAWLRVYDVRRCWYVRGWMRMLDGRYEGDWIMDGRGVGNRLPGIGYRVSGMHTYDYGVWIIITV